MFPLRDSTPRRSFPFVNYLIIFINIFVFIKQLLAPSFEEFVYQYGFIPARFSPLEFEFYKHIFYSMWLHGGFFHIASNLWFLHIFGDNVEDRIGHIKYFLFYFSAGFAAAFLQYLVSIESVIPMIGASGAISGVAGVYFVLFRRSTIEALVPDFFGFLHIVELPSWFFLGYWFLVQVFSGLGSLVTFDINQGGVAWFAHIGGFVWGYLIAQRIKRKSKKYFLEFFE